MSLNVEYSHDTVENLPEENITPYISRSIINELIRIYLIQNKVIEKFKNKIKCSEKTEQNKEDHLDEDKKESSNDFSKINERQQKLITKIKKRREQKRGSYV